MQVDYNFTLTYMVNNNIVNDGVNQVKQACIFPYAYNVLSRDNW